MRCDFALLANEVVVDQKGRLGMLGVFDHYLVSDLPGRVPRFVFAGRLRLSDDDIGAHTMRVVLRRDGQPINEFPMPDLQIEGSVPGSRRPTRSFRAHFNHFEFDAEGLYTFQLVIDGELVAETELVVEHRSKEGSAKSGSGTLMPPGGPIQA